MQMQSEEKDLHCFRFQDSPPTQALESKYSWLSESVWLCLLETRLYFF